MRYVKHNVDNFDNVDNADNVDNVDSVENVENWKLKGVTQESWQNRSLLVTTKTQSLLNA